MSKNPKTVNNYKLKLGSIYVPRTDKRVCYDHNRPVAIAVWPWKDDMPVYGVSGMVVRVNAILPVAIFGEWVNFYYDEKPVCINVVNLNRYFKVYRAPRDLNKLLLTHNKL